MGWYLDLPDAECDAIALWILAAHVFDVFRGPFPRLLVTSPTKRCGKTRLLGILERLVPRPVPTANLSAASFYRLVDATGCTLLCDEMDQSMFAVGGELVGLVNAGFQPGQGAIRCTGDDHEPRAFNVYAPMVLAGIRSHRIPDTIRDRSIIVSMSRKPSSVKVRSFRERDVAATFEPLKRKAIRWAHDNRAVLEGLDPEIPNVGNDRAADCWEVMLAVADLAPWRWAEKARAAMRALSDIEDDPTLDDELLGDLRTILDGLSLTDEDNVFGETLLHELLCLEARPWAECNKGGEITPHWLAERLRCFGLRSRSVRVGATTKKGYRVSELRGVFATYL